MKMDGSTDFGVWERCTVASYTSVRTPFRKVSSRGGEPAGLLQKGGSRTWFAAIRMNMDGLKG